MGPIWNTGGTETVINVPVSVLGPQRAGSEMGCIRLKWPEKRKYRAFNISFQISSLYISTMQ